MKIDWITLIVILLMVIALVIGILEFYKNDINECTREPLIYASKTLSESTGYDFYGIGWFAVTPDKQTPKISFNSYNVTWE